MPKKAKNNPPLTPAQRATRAAASSPWKRKPACNTVRAANVFRKTNKRDET